MSDHKLPLSDFPLDLQPDIQSDFSTSLFSILSTASLSAFVSSFDFSRLITQITSLIIIIYSSHRSFRVQRAQIIEYNNSVTNNDEELLPDSDSNSIWTTLAPYNANELHLHSKQAMMLPLGASFSLLMMFLFFDYLQLFFSTFTAIMAFFSIYLLTHDVIPYLFCCIRSKILKNSTLHNTITTIFSLLLTSFWILTSHWLIMDILGAALCVMMITFLRIPNLKTGTILLVGLLVYDVFWVFGTSYLFNRNVMLEMATKNSKNPVRIVIDKVVKIEPNGALDRHITKELVLPGKLIFPNYDFERNMMVGYSMLGLGDIVMPGIIIAFLYSAFENAQNGFILLKRTTKND